MHSDKQSTSLCITVLFLSVYRKKRVEAKMTGVSTRMFYIIVTAKALFT